MCVFVYEIPYDQYRWRAIAPKVKRNMREEGLAERAKREKLETRFDGAMKANAQRRRGKERETEIPSNARGCRRRDRG